MSNLNDNTSKPCRQCDKGTYLEVSAWNDWDGTISCERCGHTVDRYEEKTMKLEEYKPGVVCRHHSGRVYTILMITNQTNSSDEFPETVVYMGANGEVWSRPLEQFVRKFYILFDGTNSLKLTT